MSQFPFHFSCISLSNYQMSQTTKQSFTLFANVFLSLYCDHSNNSRAIQEGILQHHGNVIVDIFWEQSLIVAAFCVSNHSLILFLPEKNQSEGNQPILNPSLNRKKSRQIILQFTAGWLLAISHQRWCRNILPMQKIAERKWLKN